VTPILTAGAGALVTFFDAYFSSYRALVATGFFSGIYLLFNGFVLYDMNNRMVPAAGVITAAGIVWGILTLFRYIFETTERARITKRFSSYVDPAVVNYVVDNPDAKLDGEVKEITVVFTDLAGFTTISEKLKERTVPLLNEYMSRMLPIIRAHNGLWNKFLGDGIMFFYNGLPPNPTHARDAIRTVLDMQKSVEEFNKYLFENKLPKVAMRAGIATGDMVVGDAGSNRPGCEAADYTVLGDEVNLAARLESANKALGSRALMTQRSLDLGGDEFLWRPMGKLIVMGKTQGVMTYEPIARVSEATEDQKRLATLSRRTVEAFMQKRFNDAIAAAQEMQGELGSSKFTALYLERSREYLISPPVDGWEGTIVLQEK
jgi:adenylate cyclase